MEHHRGGKISVIVPVYNAEATISRALDSIIAQSWRNLEIIAVDDGSSDSSLSILSSYAEKYPELIRIDANKTNKGAGYTKNRGVSLAVGDFIGFVDADDYIDPDYYKELIVAMLQFDADIACADIVLEYPERSVRFCLFEDNLILKQKPAEQIVMLVEAQFVAGHWSASSACSKLFRKKIFSDFWEEVCDDIPAVHSALYKANRIVYSKSSNYHYVQSDNSLERGNTSQLRFTGVAASVAEAERRLKAQSAPQIACELLYMNSLAPTLLSMVEQCRDEIERQTCAEKMRVTLLKNDALEFFPLSLDNPLFKRKYMYSSDIYRKDLHTLFSSFSRAQWDIFLRVAKQLTSMPKVSIVIPVYNGANYMRDAINSALNQTYQNIEVVVINDGSRDNGETERIALSYGDKIRYFRKENGGVASALNLGIKKMEGQYFSWLSHDDMYKPDKISTEVNELRQSGDFRTLIFGGYQVVDSSGGYLYDVNPLALHTLKQMNTPLFALFRGCVHGCALLIHKSHFERVGLFDVSLPTTQDYDLWFRMMKGQKLRFYSGLNVLSRTHPEQGSKKYIGPHIEECSRLWIGMMERLTDKERAEIDGSPYLFYRNTADFLRNATHYDEAILHAEKNALFEAQKLNDGLPNVNALARECSYDLDIFKKEIIPIIFSVKLKRRVAYLISERHIHGVLNQIVIWAATILSDEYDVFLFYTGKQKVESKVVSKGVMKIYTPWTNDLIINFPRLLRVMEVDLLITSDNYVREQLPLHPEAQKYGIKTIAWNHESYFMPYKREYLRKCLSERNRFLSQADIVVWPDKVSANIYGATYKNSALIPYPTTIKSLVNKEGTGEKPHIVALGDFIDEKNGLEDLLRMFAHVSRINPNAELFIIGYYDLNISIPSDQNCTYADLTEQLFLSKERLHLLGWSDDIFSFFKSARVQVLPAMYEGVELVLHEASAYGIPAVVYEGIGVNTIIEDGVNGFVVEPRNIEHLAGAVLRLLEDDVLFYEMSRAVQQKVENNQSEDFLSSWREIIQALLLKEKEDLLYYLRIEYMPTVDDKDALIRMLAAEYEDLAQEVATSYVVVSEKNHVIHESKSMDVVQSDLSCPECVNLMNSFSWRITKPLRLAKKTWISLKSNGLVATIRKIWWKLK